MLESGRPRLIGPMVSSKMFEGKGFFIGPQYYYLLSVAGIITNWNPLYIDYLFLFAEIACILIFVVWVVKKVNTITAYTIFLIISTSPYLITQSRFFWNPHFLLPLGLLEIYFMWRICKKFEYVNYLFLGITWGMAFSFHYSATLWLLWILPLLVYSFYKKGYKDITVCLLMVILGFLIGDLPFFIFELKHNFYNLSTLLWTMKNSPGGTILELHYFIYPLLPILIIFVGFILSKKNKYNYLIGLILTYSLWLFQSLFMSEPIPLGHPNNWYYPMAEKVVKMILKDGCPKDFNIAETIGGDTRAYSIRFLLISRGCMPLDVEKYPDSKMIFLVAPNNRPPQSETVWEVKSLGSSLKYESEEINSQMNLWKITKI